jgi:hypothetical protein
MFIPHRRVRKPSSAKRSRRLECETLERRDLLSGNPLLPDLMGLASQSRGYLYGWTIDRTSMPGHVLLRLTATEANAGAGPLEIRGGPVNPDGTQQVFQRIYNDDGTWSDRLAGNFTYHPTHNHIHFDDIAQYNLRARPADGSVGSVVAAGAKTSFCLIDIDHFNPSLPRSPVNGVYESCGNVLQGISVGWADVYGSGLDGQWIDVTGVANGNYWLEDVLDPNNHLLQANLVSHVTRIPITLNINATTALDIVTSSPFGSITGPISSAQVTFNRAINASTFTPAEVTFTGPAGRIGVTAVTPVTGSSNTQFTITFPAQTATGRYSMLIGPNIRDTAGNLMDQDQDGGGVTGKDDLFALGFSVAGPQVTGTAPVLDLSGHVAGLQVTFNVAINPTTFTPASITQFTGPGGAISVLAVTPVTGTNDHQFEITFAPQSAVGTYSMLIAGTIRDTLGNHVNNGKPFTATFGILTTHVVINQDGGDFYFAVNPAAFAKVFGTTTF